MGRLFSTVLVLVSVLALAGQARAYGLFACFDPAGRQVCQVDSGTRTDFVPSQLCNATCPACAGRCDAVRRFAPNAGHWVETWHGAPGLDQDNRLVPGTGQDARTILREGLVAPAPVPGRPAPPPGAPRERDLEN